MHCTGSSSSKQPGFDGRTHGWKRCWWQCTFDQPQQHDAKPSLWQSISATAATAAAGISCATANATAAANVWCDKQHVWSTAKHGTRHARDASIQWHAAAAAAATTTTATTAAAAAAFPWHGCAIQAAIAVTFHHGAANFPAPEAAAVASGHGAAKFPAAESAAVASRHGAANFPAPESAAVASRHGAANFPAAESTAVCHSAARDPIYQHELPGSSTTTSTNKLPAAAAAATHIGKLQQPAIPSHALKSAATTPCRNAASCI